jgi:peptidoglycan/xylan/chitin deacetylase (PgdA/CDA1 family)
MKRRIIAFISIFTVAGLIFGFIVYPKLQSHKGKSYNQNKANINISNLPDNQLLMTNKNNVPIYEFLDGKSIMIATLPIKEEIKSLNDYHQNWYQVRFGNGFGYIPKKDVAILPYKKHSNDNLSRSFIPKNDYITVNNTPVFKNDTQPFVRTATLLKDMRYPMSVLNVHWLTFDIGGKIGYIKRSSVKIDNGIPVLTYHHLLESRENIKYRRTSTTITPEAFNQQMNYLSKNGFTSLTTTDLGNYVIGKNILPGKAVLITFDDGLQSVYRYAYPILKKDHLKAAEFMITSRIAKKPYPWNPNELKPLSYPEMANMKDVFEFQSHTNHLHFLNARRFSYVVIMPPAVVKKDIALSQKIVNAHSFAYPFGQFNNKTIQILRELGFKSAFTTKNGYAKFGDNPLMINRIAIMPNTSFPQFKNIVNL